MRKVLVTILFVCYWAVMLGPFVTYVSFYANRSYISANLCENRDNPVSECHGSCYLTKELAKTVEVKTDEQQKTPESLVVVHAFSPHTAFETIQFSSPTFTAVCFEEQQDIPESIPYFNTILDPPRV